MSNKEEEGEEEYQKPTEEIDATSWSIGISRHALQQAKRRFLLKSDDDAYAFLTHIILIAGRAKRMPNDALRWTADDVQVVTTKFLPYARGPHDLIILTAYPLPPERKRRASRARSQRTTYSSVKKHLTRTQRLRALRQQLYSALDAE